MIALFRYTLSTLMHSQRYLPPALLFICLLAVLTSSDSGPVVPVYATCAGSLFVCITWLTVALVGAEDPVSRAIVVVNARRSRDVLAATVWVALAASLVLTAAGVFYPLLSGQHAATDLDLVIGAEAQLTCAFVGIAVGLICSRLVIGRPGFSLVAAISLVMAMFLVPWFPPVHPLLTLLEGSSQPVDAVWQAAGFGLLGIGLLLVSAVSTQYIAVRRG